jgi:hypothetical protein
MSIQKYIFSIYLLSVSLHATASPQYLQYKYNDAVTIVISNVACPYPQFKDKYPFASAAFRVDGEKLSGCFRKQDENLIEIQWYKGDTTVLPANAFLVNPNGIKAEKIEPTL